MRGVITPITAALLAAYGGTVWLANWLIVTVGPVPVAPGVLAPAGVYAAGLALTLRDLVHERAGRRWALAAVLGGAALSAGLSGPLALASGAAFLVSELADLVAFDALRRRGLLWAVALSNLLGLVLDSVLFLALAFGSLAYLPGQLLGKLYMTVLAVLLLAALRRRARAA